MIDVVGAFFAQAERTPSARALRVGEDAATYRQLAARADSIAGAVAAACAPGSFVSGYFDHSLDAVAAFLAVMSAGCIYVPLAPAQGAGRAAAVAASSRARLMLTDCEGAQQLETELPTIAVDSLAGTPASAPRRAAGVAYAIFTSGSTGTPKGVAVSHASLAASTRARHRLYGCTATLFLTAPLCFDSAVSMFGHLTAGGCVQLSSSSAAHDPARLAEEAARDATELLVLPGVYQTLLDVWGTRQPEQLQTAIVAGEALTPALVAAHFRLAPTRRLVNEYGPTEATVFCTAHDCTPADGDRERVPIGRAVDGYDIALFDDDWRSADAGEIWVRGAGVALGYLGDPSATARSFVPAPDGSRWYRTGDLAARLPDGTLEYRGRRDDQVKVSGIRVELAEVERLLTAVGGLDDAVAAFDGRRIVAAVTTDGVGATEIESRVRADLPPQLAPRAIAVVEALPRSATGKVDRVAVLALFDDEPERGTDVPRTPLAIACAEVLGHPIAPEDSFVVHGDSLAAMRVVALLHAEGFALSVGSLLDGSSLATAEKAVAPLPRRTPRAEEIGVLSPGQLGVWYVDRLSGGRAFNVPLRLRAETPLDADRLAQALRRVVARHPILGIRVALIDRQPLLVDGEAPKLRIDHGDTEAIAAQEAHQPFDLRKDSPLRAVLAGDGKELLLTVHHLVFDGWSKRVLLEDLAAAYTGGLHGTATDARLHAAEERAQNYAEEARQAAAELGSFPTVLPLSSGGRQRFEADGWVDDLDPVLADAIGEAARANQTTPFVVLLTGFAAALAEATDQTRLIIGAVHAGRDDPRFERSVGLFTNVLPVGLALDPASPRIGEAKQAVLAALRRAHVPFSDVVAAVAPPRSTNHSPLVQVLFEQFTDPVTTLNFGGTRVDVIADGLQQGAVSELSMRVVSHAGTYRLVTVRDASVVPEHLARRIIDASIRHWLAIADPLSAAATHE